MKRLALALFFGLSASVVSAQSTAPAEPVVAAPATEATPATVATPAAPATPMQAGGESALATAAPAETAKPQLDPGCVRESGTRLKKRDKKGCTGAPGSSYSRADIDRTGAVDTADAIRKLSPSATVSRGN